VAQANAGRKPSPAHLKIVGGRGPGRDSGGRKIVAVLPKANLLKPLDGFALQVGCETFSRWHAAKSARLAVGGRGSGLLAKTSQGMGVSPLVRVEVEASKDFRSWCAEFGLTPAAEVRLVAAQDPANAGSGDLF
jgi:P27 family predicted phage terminase small subunit